ncbi:MAG TPA: 1-(5-phosphoribosyl)-5-[(5-phosphoribosylamino)methylideneamino] imidazole-4-carboxamide isomerase [Methylomirabilota bacterium]|jgi:phosphoribosylformimino-5-aminoimidazole carboxamide ribotide isomerase
MIVIPAIDIRGGFCVRLREGRADQETVFSEDPVAVARRWVDLGAERLHVVDLDGALGKPRQTDMVRRVIEAAGPVPVQVGGGLRDDGAVAAMFKAGARWVVLGTRAVDATFLTGTCQRHPEGIIVAVDGRGSRVAVKGWTEVAEVTVVELGRQARDAGAAALLYTDVGRDGTEQGPNVKDTATLAGAVGMPILASGGVSSVNDLRALAAIPGVQGVVVGRALYTGAIDLRQALEAV